MRVREAVEADARAMAAISDVPTDVLRNLVHDRTVRVAEPDSTAESTPQEPPIDDGNGNGNDSSDDTTRSELGDDAGTAHADTGPGPEPDTDDADTDTDADAADIGAPTPDRDILGFVSFDVREGVVHVTQVEGTGPACERLLAEPVGFARREGMVVELLLPAAAEAIGAAAETVGFEERGPGPRFEGQDTIQYRLDPT